MTSTDPVTTKVPPEIKSIRSTKEGSVRTWCHKQNLNSETEVLSLFCVHLVSASVVGIPVTPKFRLKEKKIHKKT